MLRRMNLQEVENQFLEASLQNWQMQTVVMMASSTDASLHEISVEVSLGYCLALYDREPQHREILYFENILRGLRAACDGNLQVETARQVTRTERAINGPRVVPYRNLPVNPAVANPVVANPAVANPAVANPAVANPAVANPAVADPAVANPAVANPAVADPALANPAGANPAVANLQPLGQAQAPRGRRGGYSRQEDLLLVSWISITQDRGAYSMRVLSDSGLIQRSWQGLKERYQNLSEASLRDLSQEFDQRRQEYEVIFENTLRAYEENRPNTGRRAGPLR
jgi:hypothetical protein